MKQRMIDFLNVFQGLRKTIVMLLLMIIGVWFRVKGYLDGNNFVSLFSTTVVSYFGANACEHFTSMVQDHLACKRAQAAQGSDTPPSKEEG